MEQRLAHGTSLASIVVVAVAGVTGYLIDGAVDWPVAGLLFVGSGSGALLGTFLLQRVSRGALRLAFAALLIATAARLFLDLPAPVVRAPIEALTAVSLIGVGLVSGFMAGWFGVGGGVITVPALVLLFSIPDVVAKGTSLAVIIPTAVVGTVSNLARGNADLRVGATLGVAGALSAFFGARLSLTLQPDLSSFLFALLLLAVAARMLLTSDKGRPPTGAH
ncbi:MAG: sulfite exporter TauE/SafE family protein [Actinomycetota bacterium]